jgi:hypothetical protein
VTKNEVYDSEIDGSWGSRNGKSFTINTIVSYMRRMLDDNDVVHVAKLFSLPQPHLRTRTYAQTQQSTQRATQLTGVLARAYYVSMQNLNTVINITVP